MRKMSSFDKKRVASFSGLLGAVGASGRDTPSEHVPDRGSAQRGEGMWDEM